jgi:hypothetical protein
MFSWFFFSEELPAGTQIGRYKVGEKLGKGAFAIVYKAFDTDTGDFVAVKRISKQKIRGKAQQVPAKTCFVL